MKSSTVASITLYGLATLCGAHATRADLGGALGAEEDGKFLVRAVEGSRQGATDARAAAQSTRRSEIRETARSIADDHARARRQLTDLAKQKGVSLPAEPADAPNDKVSDPDRIAGLLKAHEDAIALFHKEAVRGTDPDVKTFAQTVLPTLQRRLVVLRSLQEQYPPRAG